MPLPESCLALFDAVDKVGLDTFGSDWGDPEREERARPSTDLDIDCQAIVEAIDASMREAIEIERASKEGRPYVRLDDSTEAKMRDEIRRAAKRSQPHRERRWKANERLRKMLAAPKGVRSIAFDSQSGKYFPLPMDVWLSEYADDLFLTGRIDVRDRNGDVEFARWRGDVEPAWCVLIREDDLTRALDGDPTPSVARILRSGGRGPHTIKNVVLHEAERRLGRGLSKETVQEEAEYLHGWARSTYPDHPAPGIKVIKNGLGDSKWLKRRRAQIK